MILDATGKDLGRSAWICVVEPPTTLLLVHLHAVCGEPKAVCEDLAPPVGDGDVPIVRDGKKIRDDDDDAGPTISGCEARNERQTRGHSHRHHQ